MCVRESHEGALCVCAYPCTPQGGAVCVCQCVCVREREKKSHEGAVGGCVWVCVWGGGKLYHAVNFCQYKTGSVQGLLQGPTSLVTIQGLGHERGGGLRRWHLAT